MILRRYHRWIATLIGIFILWTATTGVLTQITRINTAAERGAAAAVARTAQAPAPPLSPNRKFLKTITDLHSGEQFGLAGQLVSLVTGLAILFLAGSGLWMYIRMFRARAAKASSSNSRIGESKWFWK
jgi:uncharacterized iron-regulated membrane protein